MAEDNVTKRLPLLINHDLNLVCSAYRWYDDDPWRIQVSIGKKDNIGWDENKVFIWEDILTVKVPDLQGMDFRLEQVANLRALKQKMIADSQRAITEVEGRIQNLLAIGNTSSAASGPEECEDEGCPHYGTPHSHGKAVPRKFTDVTDL